MKKVKVLLFIFLLSGVTFLSSCVFPGPGHGSHGGGKPHNTNNKHHGNNGDHDKGDHKDKDDHHKK